MLKQILYLILLINYLLVVYTLLVYGVLIDNLSFDVCKCNLFIFTLINLLLALLIEYYSLIKLIIK